MPSFRRRASVVDADSVAAPPQQDPERSDADEALRLAEEAEAEAAEAEARAAAARARAKAIRLRKQAEEAQEAQQAGSDAATESAEVAESAEATESAEAAESAEVAETTEADDDAATDSAAAPVSTRRRRLPRIPWKIVAVVLAVLLILGFAGASGYMVWQHRLAEQDRQHTAEYSAAARQSVVTLMSLDFNKAQEDVQRIIDNTTGQFREDFEAQAEDFAKVAKDSKVVTEVTVNVAAVKSMTDTTATAIVSATSRVTNAAGANQEPRSWRLLVDLVREGDQIKMSKVEFVP